MEIRREMLNSPYYKDKDDWKCVRLDEEREKVNMSCYRNLTKNIELDFLTPR